jgi:hypothetical protein
MLRSRILGALSRARVAQNAPPVVDQKSARATIGPCCVVFVDRASKLFALLLGYFVFGLI